MDRPAIHAQLQEIFRTLFDNASLVIGDTTTAREVPGWDSITHIDLVCAVEDEFGIKVVTREVANLSNVGEFISLIQLKVGG